MKINKLTIEALEDAKERFKGEDFDIYKMICWLHEEVGELSESVRKNRDCQLTWAGLKELGGIEGFGFKKEFELFAKNTIQGELADIAIMLFCIAGYLNVDLETFVETGMKYNKLR